MPIVQRVDAEISWQADGAGEPVVLINGLGSPSATWFRLARHLRSRFTVITCDNRGTGQTVAPSAPHDVPTMAADVAAVITAAGHNSAHVVGHSMGGMIAQELALSHPQSVRSLVLAATHPGVQHILADADLEAGAALAAAGELGPAERVVALRGLLYAAGTSEQVIAEDEAVRVANPTSPEGFRNQLLGASGWERLADLDQLSVPTLVIHGADDRIVPPVAGERLAAAITGARFELLPSTGHALFADAEVAVADHISRFLSEHALLAS
ncbi:MAG: Lipase/esterase [Frankiales bacterium]|nr:Lipase/esterase [Frankiales bacterium]